MCWYLHEVIDLMPDRKICMVVDDQHPTVLYSDSSTTGGGRGLRIGIVLLEKGRKGLCAVHDVPGWVIEKW